MEPAESVGRAVGTAGTAVVFAGATVVIAPAALAVVRIPPLTTMGAAAAVTVVVSVLVAPTLLPALLGVPGARVASSAIPALRRAAPGARWVGVVTRSRWVVLRMSWTVTARAESSAGSDVVDVLRVRYGGA
ncbi:MMPL family transporter [Embleya sp. MST-111070]|uniref:MMPL family transporter n=1 Tax=Embleya sp. MST-111070 TaxID=3398231 RepID=UPI003F73FCCD